MIAACVHAETIELHADTAFSPRERGLIGEAALRLEHETGEALRFDIAYDFDFSSMDTLRMLSGAHALLRTTSASDAPAAVELDIVSHGETLGYTGLAAPNRVYLIVDRLDSDRLFLHTAMHEMLHVIGLGHLPDPRSLMHGSTDGRDPPIALGEADRKAIRQALGCAE
jgi:hypothetical protein